MMESNNFSLFNLSASDDLAAKIAAELDTMLGQVSSRKFSDGEIQVNIQESVRGKNIYLIQATNYPVNDHLWELLIAIDAFKRASAKTINIVMPYFGYARQDRKAAAREPITAKLVANMLVNAGATRILTVDLHTVQVQGFFDIPEDNLFTIPLFTEYYRALGLFGDNVVVISPKNSGIKRARSLAKSLDAPIAIIDHEKNDSGRQNGYIIGDVKGKKVIMVDDIINTGITFYAAGEVLAKSGATEIYACASHGILANNACDLMNLSSIKEVCVTNSVNVLKHCTPKNLKIITCSKLIAQAIKCIHLNQPLSPLFQ
jgi:ribose-phosphate pyrophosphokinase